MWKDLAKLSAYTLGMEPEGFFFFKSIFMGLKLNILPFTSNFAMQNVLEKCFFFNLRIGLNVNDKFNIGKIKMFDKLLRNFK